MVQCKLINVGFLGWMSQLPSITQRLVLLVWCSDITHKGYKSLSPGTRGTQTEVSPAEELQNDFLRWDFKYRSYFIFTLSIGQACLAAAQAAPGTYEPGCYFTVTL